MEPRDVNRNRIGRWLHAGAGEEDSPELEAAWSSLLAELPELEPSAELTDRVMRRVAELRPGAYAARRAVRDLHPRWRLALVLGLLVSGASALLLPALLLAAPIPVGAAIAATADAVKAVAVWAAQGFSLWRLLAEIADTAALVAATPEVTAFLAAFALVSAAALRLLFELMHYDRRSVHVAPR